MKPKPVFSRKWGLAFLFFAAVFAVRAQKQHLQFFHLNEQDGIENLYDPKMIEDKKRGFLWLGTVSGLYRYDGETVLKVYPLPGKVLNLRSPYFPFQPFLSDSQGNLWFYDGELSIKRLTVATGLVEKIPVRSAGRQDSIVKFYPVFYTGNVF
ncbi:MAG: hypothetical protein KA138_05350, partial [Saprospiraceae bacterium]|nr:hypothetical protein [Saprospiraceae bacterium]